MMTARDAEMAYRRAFDEFARCVEQVQFLTANPSADRNTIETALLELERARAAYYQRRDEWAQHLLQSSRDSYHVVQQDQDEDRLCATQGR
jgi:hypothetical protein